MMFTHTCIHYYCITDPLCTLIELSFTMFTHLNTFILDPLLSKIAIHNVHNVHSIHSIHNVHNVHSIHSIHNVHILIYE